MSVLVKNMEMPEKCPDCNFESECGFCLAKSPDFCGYTDELLRPDWCPLIELSEEHGRLGDLDELWERMLKYTDNEGAKFPYGDDDSMIHRDLACFMIESTDTIVEAEGVEE